MDRDIRLHGHILDDRTLSRLLNAVAAAGARYEILGLDIGRSRKDPSEARLRLFASDDATLGRAVERAAGFGAELLDTAPARFEPAPADGVLPDTFYATSNLPTEVLVDGAWLAVAEEEMDLALVATADRSAVRALPMAAVRAGEPVLVGEEGVRTRPLGRPAEAEPFRFMSSEVSAEKPKGPLLRQVVAAMRSVREAGGKILLVGGPAIVHTGAGPLLAELIDRGWIDVLFAGNALAAHDIEQALFDTSLGVPLAQGPVPASGHAHHLWAINAIRRTGSIAAAVESGLLRSGVMHACVRRKVPFVLAGSIRDDGPLPDVITDAVAAQQAMREHVADVGLALMVGTTLHAIATGNLLPARVFTVCVDVNPGVVTKLRDRGSRQSLGVVMDAASFLEQLSAGLAGP